MCFVLFSSRQEARTIFSLFVCTCAKKSVLLQSFFENFTYGTSSYGLTAGSADHLRPLYIDDQHHGHRIYRQGNQQPSVGADQRTDVRFWQVSHLCVAQYSLPDGRTDRGYSACVGPLGRAYPGGLHARLRRGAALQRSSSPRA